MLFRSYSTLKASAGNNLRQKLIQLAQKLDADAGITETNYVSTINDKIGIITLISAGITTVNITALNHGLIDGRKVILSETNSSPSINNEYIVSVVDSNTFSINVVDPIITPGTSGQFISFNNDFEDLRICYNNVISKLNLDANIAFSNYSPITSKIGRAHV